ncbi:iron export ABC transporter permease subunit FetB [Candidatus Fermentibacteria bacterium]|nr:iron export ABC transporter permease subunit FetB [Candidatus Fermentibacteria bacterium]
MDLGWLQLAIAASLVLVSGGVSVLLRLKMEKRLAIASFRTIVQLLLIGYVLKWVFGLSSLLALAPVVLFMVSTATQAAVGRPRRKYRGSVWRTFMTLALTGLVVTVTATRVIVGIKPWYSAHYFIPLLGMVLGNSMNAVSLCLDELLESFAQKKEIVEMKLALGATKWEAARQQVADAVRKGMIPIINSMMVVGVVSLPGMMTGQILAGADPFRAVKYQIVIMFMIAAGTAMSSMAVGLLSFRVLFNDRHQLLANRIISRK